MLSNDVSFLILSCITLGSWVYLWLFRFRFWHASQRLKNLPQKFKKNYNFPPVTAVIPARNEEDVITDSLTSLLNQNYHGELSIILIDDSSSDATVKVAQDAARQFGVTEKIQIISGKQLPNGWTGKVWALHQGLDAAMKTPAKYYLFTDADVYHSSNNLNRLVLKAESDNLDLVSLMVKLHCNSIWDWLLIPAFIFFFQKLYPFNAVNNKESRIAAAAGGCMLIRRSAMDKIGGVTSIKSAIIDDCALARQLKENGPVWLGLTTSTRSIRAYTKLYEIWRMVTRSAFTQLNHSLILLAGAAIGMTILYVTPPLIIYYSLLNDLIIAMLLSGFAWVIMTYLYYPTLKLYNLPLVYGLLLPVAALIYIIMTVDSARRYFLNNGGMWKGRSYK